MTRIPRLNCVLICNHVYSMIEPTRRFLLSSSHLFLAGPLKLSEHLGSRVSPLRASRPVSRATCRMNPTRAPPPRRRYVPTTASNHQTPRVDPRATHPLQTHTRIDAPV